jgi:hypothetical protein
MAPLEWSCRPGLASKEGSMEFEREFRERCAARGLAGESLEKAVEAVKAFETEASAAGHRLPLLPLDFVEAHVAGLVSRGEASEARLMALARYFAVARLQGLAIRLLAYLSPIDILPAMARRLAALEGEEACSRVMDVVELPPAGSPPEAYPKSTKAFVDALVAELGPERAGIVLRWNVHGIPAAAFAAERESYLGSTSMEAWLAGYHARQVAVLESHAADGSLWFEQRITSRVVDYVRSTPEILGGVREGGMIYLTKIPYDPDRYLQSGDELEKRRLACHCPLAASAIVEGGSLVPSEWCACSAGYEKYLFDVVFGEETECEVLESVLGGADHCRFAVKIPESILAAESG